jgi:apolipoprotein N-acyltransferase
LLAGLSGALLFAADYPIHGWALQLVALVPLLVALAAVAKSTRAAVAAGAITGLIYTGASVVALEFPLLLGGPLAAYISALWMLLAAGAYQTMRWSQPWGALATGALAAVVEWADCTLVPVWGTAQAFVRVWTAAPWAIQLAAYVGVTGIVFALVSLQALAVAAWREARTRRASLIALGALALVIALLDGLRWSSPPATTLRVAAVGWTREQLPAGVGRSAAVIDRVLEPLVREAARRGARLVVTPEVALWVSAAQRAEVLARLGELARDHQIWLAAGWFDEKSQDNRIAFVDPRGALRGEYRKTHLIAGIERYQAGDGSLVALQLGRARLSGMICQDDNFTDLARRLGRHGVGLVAVPTNDWRQVKDHHLENSLFRPIENGYAIVRAASNGISVIASPRGEVLARADHFETGPQVIVADVPVGTGRTLYSRLGDFWPVLCAVALLVGSVLHDRKRQRRRRGQRGP